MALQKHYSLSRPSAEITAGDEVASASASKLQGDRPAQTLPVSGIAEITSHENVRRTIVNLLRNQVPYSESAVMAIAMAAHPWPDEEIHSSALEAITAEMLPARNLCHFDVREVSIDRLLRISEAMLYEGETRLARGYFDAANQALDSFFVTGETDRIKCIDHDLISKLAQSVISPFGIGVRSSADPKAVHVESPANADDGHARGMFEMIVQLLGAAAVLGSQDIGIICGGDATGITIRHLARKLDVCLPLDVFDSHVDQLDSRDRDVLVSRTFTLGKPKVLSQIAACWGITRERVRQREKRIRDNITSSFAKTFAAMGRPALQKHTTKIVKTDVLIASARAVTTGSKWQDAAAAVVLDVLGPWRDLDGWAIHPSIEDRIRGLRELLEESADEYGLVSNENVGHGLDDLLHSDCDQEPFLRDVLGVGRVFDYWTIKDTHRCQVAAALRYLRRPSTKEEIAELIQYPPASVGSILGALGGVVRADRYRWGFSEWIDDAYDGIVGEIRQRIDDYGGAVPVDLILKEVPSRFEVSESSVRAYLACDAFVVEDNIVRHGTADDYAPQDPASCPGALQLGGDWGQRLRLYARHFVGYSLGVSFDVAYANGIKPGDDLLVPVAGTNYEASVIWRSHSLNRLVDVGRVSELLTSFGLEEDDEILVFPTRERVKLLRSEDLSTGIDAVDKSLERDDDLAGEHQHVSDPLLDLLGNG